MVNDFLNKINLNVNSMIKYGSIASLSMLFIVLLFGGNNAMLAFPITLTAIALSFENLNVKPLKKYLSLILLDILIISLSFLASLNIYLGVIINFISIFLIAYFFTARFNPKIYKPFIMLYVFTSFYPKDFSNLKFRYFSVIFCVTFIFIYLKVSESKTKISFLKEVLLSSLKVLSSQTNYLLISAFDDSLYKNHINITSSNIYKVYKTKSKKHTVTVLGNIRYEISLSLERINMFLKDNHFLVCSSKPELLYDLKNTFIEIIRALNNKNDLNSIIKSLELFIAKYESNNYKDIIEALIIIKSNILTLQNLDYSLLKLEYSEWKTGDIFSLKYYTKENLKLHNIRFNFALRISLTLTLTLFLSNIVSFYKFLWTSITIMSVMQPYYEDTIVKGKERVLSNIFGILIILLLLTLFQNKIFTIVILIVSLFLSYGFKEYNKLSFFTAIASLSIASLNTNLKLITINRLTFVILGIVIVYISNKFLFPYALFKGIKTLTFKILNYDLTILNELSKSDVDSSKVRNYILYNLLSLEKLKLRSNSYKMDNLNTFILLNKELMHKIGFKSIYLKYKSN
ncbi:FUSC family protein [Clostridium sp. LY3-2]|uniref:FUSC family protein n=1 Tax=Clostridium sp. LY3-2 TaxID=2942482 RepID=UPI0021528E39|nr:FUSC family protein [Clostridium sp. LY3-2]MCR6515562.1 FUSC family protein [Clostridium sp. LY3-2]